MRRTRHLTVLSGGTMDMADEFLDFEGATFTNNGAVISSVASFGEVDFNGVGASRHDAAPGRHGRLTTTNGLVDFHNPATPTTVAIADGALVDGVLDQLEIDGGSTLPTTGPWRRFSPGQPLIMAISSSDRHRIFRSTSAEPPTSQTDDVFDKRWRCAHTGWRLGRALNRDFTPSPSDTFTIYQTQVPSPGSSATWPAAAVEHGRRHHPYCRSLAPAQMLLRCPVSVPLFASRRRPTPSVGGPATECQRHSRWQQWHAARRGHICSWRGKSGIQFQFNGYVQVPR